MTAKYKAVLFDFDGTLVDTSKGIFSSVLYALGQLGIKETDISRLNYFIGPPLQHSFMHQYNVDKETADRLIEKYREHYSAGGLYECELYSGIEDILRILCENSVKTAIASSKPEPFIRLLLEKFNIEQYFDAVSAIGFEEKNADKALIIKNAVHSLRLDEGSEILMVGDRHFDIIGAEKNRIDSVGVLYGFGSRQEFEAAGATYIIKNPCELENIVFE